MVLNNASLDSINPYFSVSNDTIYAVWISNMDARNSEVLFKKIGSNSKSSFVNISGTIGISNLAKLSSSGDNVYITWEDKQIDKWNLLFRKSHDNGTKFANVTNLSNDTGNVHIHDLSSVGNNVFVLWAANENVSSSNKEIFFRKSQDGGNSFSDILNLSNDSDDSLNPHMVINQDGSIIYIVWTKCDIEHDDPICSVAFTRSLDQGNTFTPSMIINNSTSLPENPISTAIVDTVSNSSSTRIDPYLLNNVTVHKRINSINPFVFTTLIGNIVYVIWEQSTFGNGDSEILLTSSNDYGESFNSTINISNSSGISRLAHGHILGDELYVAWSDTLEQSRTFDVLLRKVDAKNQLDKVLNLSNNLGNSVSPYMLAGNSSIFVTWIENTEHSSVVLATIDLSGSTVTEKIVSGKPGILYTNPLIFETENKIWIGWVESNKDFNNIVLINQEKS